jgi:hypothetical protein
MWRARRARQVAWQVIKKVAVGVAGVINGYEVGKYDSDASFVIKKCGVKRQVKKVVR